ncbi:MAG TPA: double zinc ribbon domain-containing protein, partial [Burkholderiales bacterium]
MLPHDCMLCGDSGASSALCNSCHRALPWLPAERCPVCAVPSPGNAVCGACLAEPPPFRGSRAALAYEFPVDALIQSFKYAGDLAVGEALGELLRDAVREAPRPDALVPMPLHPARLRERGFNQALELARRLGRDLDLPVLAQACRRLRDTPPQASLP